MQASSSYFSSHLPLCQNDALSCPSSFLGEKKSGEERHWVSESWRFWLKNYAPKWALEQVMMEKPSNVPHKSGLFCLMLLQNFFKTSEGTAWLAVWPCGTNSACKTPLTSKKQMSSEVGLHLMCCLGVAKLKFSTGLTFVFFGLITTTTWLITSYNLRKLIIVNGKLNRTRNVRRLVLLILAIILNRKFWSSYVRHYLLDL